MKQRVIGNLILIIFTAGFNLSSRLNAQTIHDQAVTNIAAFARLYGYVRFFHPADEASRIDWQKFALYGIKRAEPARDRSELKKVLQELFLPIAPSLLICDSEVKMDFSVAGITPPEKEGMKTVAWQHSGVGLAGGRSIYKSIRVNRKNKIVPLGDYGYVSRQLDPESLRGKEIKIRAAVKAEVEKKTGQGQLWLRVDLPDGQVGFFDDRPIQSSTWKYYEIIGQVADNAQNIAFGCVLSGLGKVWVDDFQFFVKEADIWKPVQITNLDFEVSGHGGSPKEWRFNDAMYTFQLVDRTAQKGNKSLLIQHKTLIEWGPMFDQIPDIGEVIAGELGGGLSCIVPLALYGTGEYTYPQAPEDDLRQLITAIEKEVSAELSGNDLYVRLAGIIITWNILQHFYPYFYEERTEWRERLPAVLREAYRDMDKFEYLKLLQKFTAALNDGHVGVFFVDQTYPLFNAPIVWDWVEEQLVVTEVMDGNCNIRRGDIVMEIDGVKAGEALSAEEIYISAATTGWRRFKALGNLLKGKEGAKKRFKILRDGKVLITDIEFNENYRRSINFSDEKYKMIEEGIHYLNLGVITWPEIDKMLPQLEKARSIIFDLRGYPKGNHQLLSHLLKEEDNSSWMHVPQIIYPDYKQVNYRSRGWNLKITKPTLTAKLFFLIDGRAISYAESIMGYIEHNKLAVIVGQPSAGTNGNVNIINLPGGYRISWTGMRITKHDGSRHHCVGIVPHVLLQRTIIGIKEGRDEFLEKTIELARE